MCMCVHVPCTNGHLCVCVCTDVWVAVLLGPGSGFLVTCHFHLLIGF